MVSNRFSVPKVGCRCYRDKDGLDVGVVTRVFPVYRGGTFFEVLDDNGRVRIFHVRDATFRFEKETGQVEMDEDSKLEEDAARTDYYEQGDR